MSKVFDFHLSANIYTLAQFLIYCGAVALILWGLSKWEVGE